MTTTSMAIFPRSIYRKLLKYKVYISHRFIGDNQIYGSIPPGIVNLVNLEIISMEKNQLISGTIPDDIGKLKKLQALNLHENR